MLKKAPALLTAFTIALASGCGPAEADNQNKSQSQRQTQQQTYTQAQGQSHVPTQGQISGGDHNIHGWDRMDNAEFVMHDVPMKFLFPRPGFSTTRDVAVDCDLLLRRGDHLARGDAIPTNGFAMQFNAETDYTRRALEELDMASGNAPGTALSRIQAWRGQLDPRGLNGAINTHLSPQHGITIETLRDAANICIEQHSDHGVKISELRNIAGGTQGIHPDWTNDR